MQGRHWGVLNDRVFPQWRSWSLQMPPWHLHWVASLVHLSPAIISRQWKAPGNVWLLSTPKFQNVVWSVGEVMGVGKRPAGASVASIMETQRMFSSQGHERMSLRRRVGVVHLTLLLPCSVGRWSRKMVRRKRLSLLLPLQT